MRFLELKEMIVTHFNEMVSDAENLFEVEVNKDEMYELYLNSFPEGMNEVYRERREYDCSCCKQFIRNIGNMVVIKNNKVETIWDINTGDADFQMVMDALSEYIHARPVTDVYVTKESQVGTKSNKEMLPSGEVKTWNHFYVRIPNRFVDKSHRSEGDIKGTFRDTRNVFKRSLDEIDRESVDTVLELINQNSLYKGSEWKAVLENFLRYKNEYMSIPDSEKENYAWEKSTKAGAVVGKIRNHSIGTLLVDISEGMDLDTAVKKYEKIVAPANYKRPKAIFTKKMLEAAQKTVEELGYMDSLPRRFARLDDISVNNILFANRDAAKRISGNVFEDMATDVVVNPKRFSKVEEISIDQFVSDVLPTARELEVFFENRHAQNMVSLIAPQNPDAPTMFKWNNGFGWAYTGNMTDSNIKENVKSAGGQVDGVLRFSIQWNDLEPDGNDLDAHCIEPNGHEIFFRTSKKPNRSIMSGQLDVDIIHPIDNEPAVENIVWNDKSMMQPGVYKFFVHNYTYRGGRNGFRAEIEFDGQIHYFDYSKELRDDERVYVAEVTLDERGVFTIKDLLPSNVSSREVWGVKTNQFIPVSVMCYSPNYWDEQSGIGHKHFFFMLKDCVNPERPNGFYNEFLRQELVEHKRVFEALGSRMAVQDVDDQLSGIGFSSTKRAELIVKVKGATERTIKIKF